MSVNIVGDTNFKPGVYRYLNENVIKPTQLLIKQETTSLILNNDELRRNNQDLSNRIDQMFVEFDLASGSDNRINWSDQTDQCQMIDKASEQNQAQNTNIDHKHDCNLRKSTMIRTLNNTSPVYLDIYDSSTKISLNQATLKDEHQQEMTSYEACPSPIYSQIIGKRSHQLQFENTTESKTEQLNPSSADPSKTVESQGIANYSLSNDSNLEGQNFASAKFKKYKNIETSFNTVTSSSSKTGSNQATLDFSSENVVDFSNENSIVNQTNDPKFERYNHRKTNNSNLSEPFSLVLTKSDEINVEFNDKNIQKNSNAAHQFNSQFSRGGSNCFRESKYSLSVILENATEFCDENQSSKLKNRPGKILEESMSNQAVDDSILTNRTSTDNDDRTYSNDLESSYETLYDPVLNSKTQINDENIIYM